jgi:hypothetical protein
LRTGEEVESIFHKNVSAKEKKGEDIITKVKLSLIRRWKTSSESFGRII